jgi:hypothetical protein
MTAIVLVVLSGCDTWSLTEECTITALEKRTMRGLFVPKEQEIRGDWRTGTSDSCSLQNVLVRFSRRLAGLVARRQSTETYNTYQLSHI